DIAIANLKSVVDAGAIGTDGENLWNLGFTYILAQRNDDALRTLGDYLAKFSDGDYTSNALFWSGKLLDKEGRREERDNQWRALIEKYPYGYFSYRVDVILSRADGEESAGKNDTGPSASSRLRM